MFGTRLLKTEYDPRASRNARVNCLSTKVCLRRTSISICYVCLVLFVCHSAFCAAGRSRTGHQTFTRPDRHPATGFHLCSAHSLPRTLWQDRFSWASHSQLLGARRYGVSYRIVGRMCRTTTDWGVCVCVGVRCCGVWAGRRTAARRLIDDSSSVNNGQQLTTEWPLPVVNTRRLSQRRRRFPRPGNKAALKVYCVTLLLSYVTPSLSHSRVKTCLFHKSFPPWTTFGPQDRLHWLCDWIVSSEHLVYCF